MGMTVEEAKPKTENAEKAAYQQLKYLAQIYLSTREKLATSPGTEQRCNSERIEVFMLFTARI